MSAGRRSRAAGALESGTARLPGPVRTCVGCRVRAAKADLLRVVAAGGVLAPDPFGRLPGRGASVHPDPACVALAERRRAFPRALRLAGPLDATAVQEHVRQLHQPQPHQPQPDQRRPDRPDPPDSTRPPRAGTAP